MKVFHGATELVRFPQVSIGRDNLDFGKGFYVTDRQEQAERWAISLSFRRPGSQPILNLYELDMERLKGNGYRYRCFDGYSTEWLDFVVESRRGGQPWIEYDIIEGGVANDRVFDTIENYLAGQISKETALGRLRYEAPNNQLCLLNQQLVDECLSFQAYVVIK